MNWVFRMVVALWLSSFSALAAAAPAPITGTWTGEFKSDNEVQLNLRMSDTSDQLGQQFPFASLRGLTRPQGISSTPVRFELVRDAGTVAFEGAFKEGAGSGFFTFTPRAAFVDDMATLGFRNLSGRELLTMAVIDVTRGYARELKALGYDRLSTKQLISMRIFHVTRAYVSAMRSQGYDRLQPERLVQMGIFHVTPDFVRELRALGYDQLPVDQLVQMRIFKIDPDLIRGLQRQGYRHPSVGDLVHFRIFGGLPASAERQ